MRTRRTIGEKDVFSWERTQAFIANKGLIIFLAFKSNWFLAQINPKRTPKRGPRAAFFEPLKQIRESKGAGGETQRG